MSEGRRTAPEQVAGNAGGRVAPFLLGAAVLLSRIPFLSPGYGLDADADRIAIAARSIALTGRYSVSRFPGYPIVEIAAAGVWGGGPVALDGATALMGALAVIFFALMLRSIGVRDALLASAALAFTPVVALQSTTSMDYMWALAFAMAGLWLATLERPLAAGILLGFATGCRLTSILMVAPGGMIVARGAAGRGRAGRIAWLVAGAVLVAGASYTPALLTYGTGFLSFSAAVPVPAVRALADATVGVWGQIGLIGLALALGSIPLLAIPRRRGGASSRGESSTGDAAVHGPTGLPARPSSPDTSLPAGRSGAHVAAAAVGLVLYLLLFARLPLESGYLVPAVPFAIILLSRALDRRVFAGFCLLMLIAPFVTLCGWLPCRGALPAEHAARVELEEHTAGVIALARTLPPDSVLVVGSKGLPRAKIRLPAEAIDPSSPWPPATNRTRARVDGAVLVSRLDEARYAAEIAAGRQVWYLSEVRGDNIAETGFDLKAAGARAIEPLTGGAL